MAEASPVRHLCEEATCPVCLEYFTEPVMVDCGHVFCLACVARCCEKLGEGAACPQCREPVEPGNFRPARHLASIVEIAKKFSLQLASGTEALGRVCERHQEPLRLFCRDDETLVCVVCDKSSDHKGHSVILKEEAFVEYKGIIQNHLRLLKKETGAVKSSQRFGEAESQKLMGQTEAQRQKIVTEFGQLHKFLEEQEHLLLAQLKDLDNEVKDYREKHLAKLLEELSSLDNLIKEMEEKQKQPADEFLQDLRNTLQRCPKEKFVSPEVFPSDLKERIEQFSEKHFFLQTAAKTFQDTVISGSPKQEVLPQKVHSQWKNKNPVRDRGYQDPYKNNYYNHW